MAEAASATTTRMGAHVGRRELMLGFISKFHAGTCKYNGSEQGSSAGSAYRSGNAVF